MKHKHIWHLKECRQKSSYEEVRGNKKLTLKQRKSLLENKQEFISFYDEIAVFICECGKKKEVIIKQ